MKQLFSLRRKPESLTPTTRGLCGSIAVVETAVTHWSKCLTLLLVMLMSVNLAWGTTYDFTSISGFSSWGSSYAQHVVEYTDATVTFASANKQGNTITTMPVTKGSAVSVVLNNTSNAITAVTFTCKQWSDKAQTITLKYSTNGGSSYSTLSPSVTSTNFTISSSSLPTGTNAVQITFSSTSNQVGIQSCDITISSGCTAPTITKDLSETEVVYSKNATATTLSITAIGTDVTYQWYSNTSKSTTGATTLAGQTTASYSPSTATTGTRYYYCVASSGTCTTTSKIAKITVNAPAYSISYNLDGGTHGTNHPASVEIGTAFAVSPPTKAHYTFTGWQVTSGLNTSTAKWGSGSALLTGTITSSTQKCIINTTNDIYFKDLGVNGTSVTLTATWEEDTKYTITFADKLHSESVSAKSVYENETFTFPTIDDKTAATSGTCEQIHYHFMGWSTSEGSVSVGDIKTGTSAAVTAAATYYAVWAKEEL